MMLQKNRLETDDRLLKVVWVVNWQQFFDIMEELEREGVMIQVIPCDLVVCDEILDFVLDLVIEMFNSGKNIAKKLYMEYILRFLAKTQIREVISIMEKISAQAYCLIVYSRSNRASVVYENLLSEGIIKEVPIELCKTNIDRVVEVYELDKDRLTLQAKFRNQSFEEILCKAILEKISLSLISK